jgi:hypothetical protein
MIGDESRFLTAKAQVLQQLRDVEDVVEDTEAVVNELLDHGRAPAGAAEPGLDWPFLKECG